jgi:hypothetical protein
MDVETAQCTDGTRQSTVARKCPVWQLLGTGEARGLFDCAVASITMNASP